MSDLNMPLRDGLFGDWEKCGRWFTEKSKTMDKFGNAPMLECAEYFIRNLKENIENQSFSWAPLSAAYLQYKKEAGLGTLTLIETRSYLEGLKVSTVEKTSNGYRVFAGADPDAIHDPSGLPMAYLGSIHEYGTRDGRIPARPHIRPTWERCRVECRNIWLRHFREYVRVK